MSNQLKATRQIIWNSIQINCSFHNYGIFWDEEAVLNRKTGKYSVRDICNYPRELEKAMKHIYCPEKCPRIKS